MVKTFFDSDEFVRVGFLSEMISREHTAARIFQSPNSCSSIRPIKYFKVHLTAFTLDQQLLPPYFYFYPDMLKWQPVWPDINN